MKRFLFILFIFSLLSSCSAGHSNFPAYDVRIFKGTPAWQLAKAVDNEDTAKIKKIIERDTFLLSFQENKFGMTLLNWAVYNDKFYSAKVLAELGANPNIQSHSGSTAFILGANKQRTSDYIRLLLKHGGDVNTIAQSKDQHLRTPLIAAASTNLENVKILVEAGADIDFMDESYRSALKRACVFSKIDIVRYLIIEKGADFKRPVGLTIDGDSTYMVNWFRHLVFPLDSEKYKIKMEVVDYMKEHGVNYWETPIPDTYQKNYPKEFLEKY